MSSLILGRLLLAVSFIAATEILISRWIAPGWLSLASGFVGSIVLIIPAARLEFWKVSRIRLTASCATPELRRFKTELDTYFVHRIAAWHTWDSLLMVIGGSLLSFYFLLQIPYKAELVTKPELSEQIDKLRMEQIDRLRLLQRDRLIR